IWRQTLNGDSFLLIDQKQQPVFGTLSSLQQLCSSDHLFMDGTFSSCTYTNLLAAIQRICYENHLIINPKYITIDFETAIINSLSRIFPNAAIKGCNFHFNKYLYKRLQALGFQSAFINAESTDINDINVRNLYKKTAALASTPPNQIPNLWVQIMDDFQYIQNIEPFFDYFTTTCVDGNAMFDYSLWNYFDFLSHRTNNNVEGWHCRLNSLLYHVHHPNIYVFVNSLKEDFAFNTAIITQTSATGATPSRKKLYVQRNTRILDLEKRF
ncbi:unnamed protein product, partial [Didymodactylos carnosus]